MRLPRKSSWHLSLTACRIATPSLKGDAVHWLRRECWQIFQRIFLRIRGIRGRISASMLSVMEKDGVFMDCLQRFSILGSGTIKHCLISGDANSCSL